jgi:hypothetical protein
VISGVINKRASKITRKIPFNDVANDKKRITALPVPTRLTSKSSRMAIGKTNEKTNGKISGKASGKAVSYKSTAMKGNCPLRPLRPITKAMIERSRLRAEILEYKEQLAEIRRETYEIKESNKAIESRTSKLRDELVQIGDDREILSMNIEQTKVINFFFFFFKKNNNFYEIYY